MAIGTTSTIVSTMAAEKPLYPRGIPFKFDPDGNEQRYPGNTIICHIPSDSLLVTALHTVYDTLKLHPTLGKVARLLPPSSWHMTVFDGAREEECEPGMWPEDLEKIPLKEYTANYSKTLKELGQTLHSEGLSGPYRMKVTGYGPLEVGIGLALEGVDAAEEQRMRRLRDRLADCLGFRAPNHHRYEFHITVAYWLRHMEGKLKSDLDNVLAGLKPTVCMEVDLGALEFCVYEGMCHFERKFYIGEN